MSCLDRKDVLKLIRENPNEGSRLEFKQKVDIHTAIGKAEFVRDVIALANSEGERPRSAGRLVLGVKSGRFNDISSEHYDGATFREIINANVSPPLRAEYAEFAVTRRVRIGVLEITPDDSQLYLVRKDFAGPDGKKLLAAGQSWERKGDQKVRMTGDAIALRIEELVAASQGTATAPLRERVRQLEDVLRQSGPLAEIRRIRYVIELETDWRLISEEIPKLMPYGRDFGVTVGPHIVRIIADVAGRLSGATPVAPIQACMGVFRATLPFSSDEAFRRHRQHIPEEEQELIRDIVRIVAGMIDDAASRLKRDDILECTHYLLLECARFAHMNELKELQRDLLATYDHLIATCIATGVPRLVERARLLQWERDEAILSPAERERRYRSLLRSAKRDRGNS